MKKSTIILLILIAIFFTSILVLLCQNQYKNPSVTLTSQSGLTPTIAPADSIAGWKKYEDTQFGILFYYPREWTVVNESSGLFIISPETSKNLLDSNNTWTRVGDIIITKITDDKLPNNKTKLPLNQWINSEDAKNYGINQPAELYNLGGLKGYKVISCAEMCVEEVYLEGNNIIFKIDSGNYDRFTSELSQILSTFKFTDPTANWKTHTNNTYNISFQYPSTFSVSDKLPKTKTQSAPNAALELTDSKNNYQVSIIIDPDGFGPIFADKKITLDYSPTKGLFSAKVVLSTEEDKQYLSSDKKAIWYQFDNNMFSNLTIITIAPKTDTKLETLTTQILSTFKFTENKAATPRPISDLFTKINNNFGLNLIPVAENEFYSPSGMIIKKSWKINFVDTTLGKSLTSFLRQQLEPNDAESGGIGGGGTDAYQNNQIKCYHTYGYRSGNPTNWTDPFNYLSCAEK